MPSSPKRTRATQRPRGPRRAKESRRVGLPVKRTEARKDATEADPPAVSLGSSVSSRIDKTMVAAALSKHKRGITPSTREQLALRKWEEAHEETKRWQYYRTVPQKHWREMSGRQAKVLNEQAVLYGLPFGTAVIDLPAVIRALHDFLARNAKKLSALDCDDPLLVGESSPALERYRDERAKLAKMDRQERERTLLPREEIHEMLGRVARIIRGAGDGLQRQYGSEAHALLDEAMDDADKEIETYFAERNNAPRS